MITKHRNGSCLMKFGADDIGITIGGVYGMGAVMFNNQEPRKAAIPTGAGPTAYSNTCDFPVSMVFTSPESIDSLVHHLWYVKKILEGQIVLCPEESDDRNRRMAAGM